MKASSLPNLNCETTSYPNFFTLFQEPNNDGDTTDTEASETSPFKDIQFSSDVGARLEGPNFTQFRWGFTQFRWGQTLPSTSSVFKDILSPFVSFNEMNENHYEWDLDQMDQTLHRWPPSPNGSDTDVSVGSNEFSSDVGARLEIEGEGVTQLRRRFSSGLELANLLLSSGLLHHSWAEIEEFYRETPADDPTSPLSVKYKIQQSPIGTIISFISSPPCSTQYLQEEGRDLLVSSEQLMRENFTVFQFVSTKVNPTFSLLRAAVTLFSSLQDQLSFLRTQYGNTRPLIVTGHSIGGCIATLFTLWLLETISPKDTKRPLCITFGSPLIGDTGLQQAILERPTWNSCFLHLSSYKDPIPKFFATSPQNGCAIELGHKPFGTFLLCSESGFAYFEKPESALDLMVAISLDGAGNSGPLQSFCYGEILKIFKCGVICRGVSKVGGRDFSPLQTGLFIQAEGIDVKAQLQRLLENGDIDSLIAKMEKITMDLVLRKRNVCDPTKKLSDIKINMTYLEWYKKRSVPHGGYYDVFKSKESATREEIVKRKRILTRYWVQIVKEAEKMSQKEWKFFLLKWLYGGNNYRRMVEPLEIAEFYKKGNKDYLAQRSDHYKLLEKWVEDEKSIGNQSNAEERNRACSLTKDSCFWACVEEAMILCKLLRNEEMSPEVKESQRENLVKFEDYVMDLVRKYAVSTEIFLKQSSFMQWWEDYKEIKGASHHSLLTDFMSNCKYKQYA